MLDLDATDDPLHGHQKGRFFHGYYDCYCYLPLYIFCDDHLPKGPNPRFVLTSLSKKTIAARQLYEQTYCARGDMENRIKKQQLYLFTDRTSSHSMHANQLRLWFFRLSPT